MTIWSPFLSKVPLESGEPERLTLPWIRLALGASGDCTIQKPISTKSKPIHPAMTGTKGIPAGEGKGVRVVSFPSWELFEKQDEAYRESVLPKNIQKNLYARIRIPVKKASIF